MTAALLTWEVATYELVAGGTRYRRTEATDYPLPECLSITRPWAGKIKADYVLSPGDAPKDSLTGLRKVGRYYVGDIQHGKRRRLLVAILSECRERLHFAVADRKPRASDTAAVLGYKQLVAHRRAQLNTEHSD